MSRGTLFGNLPPAPAAANLCVKADARPPDSRTIAAAARCKSAAQVA